jgi:hypothetical protein
MAKNYDNSQYQRGEANNGESGENWRNRRGVCRGQHRKRKLINSAYENVSRNNENNNGNNGEIISMAANKPANGWRYNGQRMKMKYQLMA